MDSSVSPKDEIWFLCVYHHISTGLYHALSSNVGLMKTGNIGTVTWSGHDQFPPNLCHVHRTGITPTCRAMQLCVKDNVFILTLK